MHHGNGHPISFSGLRLVIHHGNGQPMFCSGALASFDAMSAERGSAKSLLVGRDMATVARVISVRSFMVA